MSSEDDTDLVEAHLELVDNGLRNLVYYIAQSDISNHYKMTLITMIGEIIDAMPMVA